MDTPKFCRSSGRFQRRLGPYKSVLEVAPSRSMPLFELPSIAPFQINKRGPELQRIWISSTKGPPNAAGERELIPEEGSPPPPREARPVEPGTQGTRWTPARRAEGRGPQREGPSHATPRFSNSKHPGPSGGGCPAGGGGVCGGWVRAQPERGCRQAPRASRKLGHSAGKAALLAEPRGTRPAAGPRGGTPRPQHQAVRQGQRRTEAGPREFGPARILPW